MNTSTARRLFRALDFDSTPTSSKKKQKIAKEDPIDEVNFLSEENLNEIICHDDASLDPDDVKITPYKEKAVMVAKKYPPKSLMVPFIKLATIHKVKLDGVDPSSDFTTTDKSSQYLVQLLMKIRRNKEGAG